MVVVMGLELRARRLADELTATLRPLGSPERAAQEQRYLRSDLVHLGVSVPAVRRSVRALVSDHGPLSHDEVVALAVALWDEPVPAVHERRMATVELLERCRDQLGVADAPLLERFLREARTWALLDGLAASVVGELVLADEEAFDPLVRRWATDQDLWLRRASLLVHLPGVRQGTADVGRLLELADPMLEEREPFIRKAIGWLLRELGAREPATVLTWLEPRLGRAAGLTVREAVKRLPEADRQRLLAARRAR
jgi:3-methyladenine DNA glycosylase AlkD